MNTHTHTQCQFDRNEGIKSQLEQGKVINFNQLIQSTVTNPNFL